MTEMIMTVRGPVDADEIGFLLPHEHTFIDLPRTLPTQLLAYDFQLIDPVLVRAEVAAFVTAVENSPFADAGRPGLVELTNSPAVGRDPARLLDLSTSLDLHVVMSVGWYREPWFGPEIDRLSADDLAARLVAEIEDGVEGSGVRPGIIGELGTDRDFVSAQEERVLRAGARAHQRTGLPITLHARASRVALSQLAVLREEGVPPESVIVGHVDSIHDPDYHAELARLGVWVEFDTIRGSVPYVRERGLRYLREARDRGYLDQVLTSSDVCAQSHLHAYGGSGYDYLPTVFADDLRGLGLTDDDLRRLFVDNPRRALRTAR